MLNPPCQGQCRVHQIRFGEFIHQADAQRVLGRDRLAVDDHLQCLGRTDQAGQALGSSRAGQQAELDFGQAETGVRCGDAVVAAERDLEPAAQRGSVYGRDHGFLRLFQALYDIGQLRLLGREGKLFDVGTGKESRSLAKQHQRFDTRVGLRGGDGGFQARPHCLRERIDRRVVD
ncbi:hypothetical protein D3C86_1352930 [compost metagenome]